MIVQFAEKGVLQKIRARPDLAREVLEKARRDGLVTTLQAVMTRLDQPMALGYSVGGTIVAVGDGVPFRVGDRVACAGANYATHAELVSVPKNLVAPLPDEVSFDDACFTTIGAVALHGVRLTETDLGEWAAVIGLGLVGQITVQLLRAAGVRVVGMDINGDRASSAKGFGALDVATTVEEFVNLVGVVTRGRGVDATLICADSSSDGPVRLAADVTRDKGVVVVVGSVGLELPRKQFFEKELTLRISRSYGPGRYDPEYEERGHDYPYGYVRWTEQRNLEAVVQLIASGALDVGGLITHRFAIADAPKAFDVVTGKTNESFLGVLLEYPARPDLSRRLDLSSRLDAQSVSEAVRLGVLGAGLFASAILLQAIKRTGGVSFEGVCTASGLTAEAAGRRFGFRYVTTDPAQVLGDPAVNAVAILTRHRLHAGQVSTRSQPANTCSSRSRSV